jgi:predicted Zn-dependent protease
MRLTGVTVLVALATLVAGGGVAAAPEARRTVTLVPLGRFSEPSLQALAQHFRQRLHVRVSIRGSLAIPASAYNGSRKQFTGETLVGAVERVYRTGVVIAVTAEDIYMASRSFRFVFSVRDQRAAVVSTARMDPRFYGLPADGELWHSRIAKMVTKNIGTLAFRRRESPDPRSVLYGSILSFDDLDYMTEQFKPTPYSANKRAWLAGADAACTKARSATNALASTPITTTNDALTVLGQLVRIETTLVATISKLKPARSDEKLVAKLRTTLAQSVTAGQTELSALTAHWDPERLRQWLKQNETAGYGLKATALRLGSKPCAVYFGA